MKANILFFLALLCMGIALKAQAPQAIKYQAVARDTDGNILSNQPVAFRISILAGSAVGPVLYSERQEKTTNNFGLAGMDIGLGYALSGVFSFIPWESNTYFIKVELDPAGGTAYQLMGTSQLLSVPYALYAEKSGQPLSAGTGINISGNTISNTAPDLPVTLAPGSGISVSGTYPSFTIGNTAASPWGSNGTAIFYISGNVGLGTTNPQSALQVMGTSGTEGSLGGDLWGVTGKSGGCEGHLGYSNTGVFGVAWGGAFPENIGGYFTAGNGMGSSIGVAGVMQSPGKQYGVLGNSYGTATEYSESYGVYGAAHDSRDGSYGVYGLAENQHSGVNYGVYGTAWGSTTANWAGYFDGNVTITGDLLNVRNIPYTWPAAQGAAGTTLLNDGAGNLSWSSASGGGYWQRIGTTLSPAIPGDRVEITTNSYLGAVTGYYGANTAGTLGHSEAGVKGTNNYALAGCSGVQGANYAETIGTHGIYGYNNAATFGFSATRDGSLNGIVGYAYNGYPYHFGVFGTRWDDAQGPSAGVIGTVSHTDDSKPWGALGYQDVSLKEYAGYFNGPVRAALQYFSYGPAIEGDGNNNGSGGVFSNDIACCVPALEAMNSSADGVGISAGSGGSIIMMPGTGGAFTGTKYGCMGLSTDYIDGHSWGGYFFCYPGNGYVGVGGNYLGTLYKINGTGTVATIVGTPDGRKVNMFCPESPEIQLTDNGTGKLVRGKCHISLDPVFSNNIVVNENYPLKVFVQLRGDCNGVFVTNETREGFDVTELKGGASDASFFWSVIAGRCDEKDQEGNIISKYLGVRFPPAPPKPEVTTVKHSPRND